MCGVTGVLCTSLNHAAKTLGCKQEVFIFGKDKDKDRIAKGIGKDKDKGQGWREDKDKDKNKAQRELRQIPRILQL